MGQWIECQPANQRVASLIPSQDTCLGYGPDSHLGACERQLMFLSHIVVSLPLFLPSFPSLKIKIKSLKKKKENSLINKLTPHLEKLEKEEQTKPNQK